MNVSARRALLNYLEFLKNSGFLYMNDDGRSTSPPAPAPGPAVITDTGRPRASLEELAAAVADCRACELHAGRTRPVFADGPPDARIAFVGEAPGAEEDRQGVPFVGRAGQLLDKMIEAIGLSREEVYICNTLKCRPPGNRDPLPAEKKACERFLIGQLELVRPCLLVALGAHAANFLCATDGSLGRLRGQWHAYRGIPLRVTYHPSFLLRPTGVRYKPEAWKDFQEIHRKYCELNPDDVRPIWARG